MFCKNCGIENKDNVKFCRNCGSALSKMENEQKDGSEQKKAMANAPKESKTSEATKANLNGLSEIIKKLPKKTLGLVAAAVVAVIILISLVLSGGKTINLNDYMTITTNGYNGYGTASVKLDWKGIEAKYGEKLAFTNKAKSEYGGLLNAMTPIDIMLDFVSMDIDVKEKLSNGDKVTYTFKVNETLYEYLNCKVKYKNGTHTVAGLEEVETFDAFDGLVITFSGVAPEGKAKIEIDSTKMSYSDYKFDKDSGLSNGDVVTVKIDEKSATNYAKTHGKIPETLTREYEVMGLSRYVTSTSDITDEALADMKAQAEDVYNAYVAKRWSDDSTLESFTYIGNYLLTSKSKDNRDNNILYMVYKAQARNVYSNKGNTYDKINDIYWYISFKNLMIDNDGNLSVDITNYQTPKDSFSVDSGISSGWWSTKAWSYNGYQTLDGLYKKTVTVDVDAYKHEDNVDESVAPVMVEKESTTDESGFIFANSATQLLEHADLEGLTAEECKIARNEIYARHGRKFEDDALQTYFESCAWYNGSIEAADFSESMLNDIEIQNRDMIVNYEKEMNYR